MNLRIGLLVVAVVFSLLGCGGGTVSIQPQEEGVRPATVVIQDLGKAKTREEREGQLRALRERRGDHLAWDTFWEQLNQARVASDLIRENAESLFALHSRSCSPSSFISFAKFVQDRRAGWEFLVGDKRVCRTALPPDLVISIFITFLNEKPIDDRSSLEIENILTFLNEEMLRTPQGWKKVFSPEAQVLLNRVTKSALAHRHEDTVIETATIFRTNVGSFPFRAYLRDVLIIDPKFGPNWIQSHGAEDFSRLLLQLLTPEELAASWNKSSASVEHILSPLLNKPFDRYVDNTLRAWEQFVRLREVVELLSEKNWPLTEKLITVHRLHDEFTAWFAALSEIEAQDLVDKLLTNTDEVARLPDLTWFVAQRFETDYEPRHRLMAGYRTNATPNQRISAVDRVLNARLQVHAHTDSAERKSAVDVFCALLEKEGLPRSRIASSELTTRLEQGIGPGCFDVIGGKGPDITANRPLLTSPDTVLAMRYATVRLKAPTVSLGIVDMSAPRNLLSVDLRGGNLRDQLERILNGGNLQIRAARLNAPAFVSLGNRDPKLGRDGDNGSLDPAGVAR